MLVLVILADDLTGALDTGVQFASSGIRTAVTIGTPPASDCAVAVCDLETRHLAPGEAFARTAEAFQNAGAAGARLCYVKTDSGLRGNIGAALSAVSQDGRQVLFAPSFPENRRITKGGIHYIDGVPVSKSFFARDAQNPVLRDRVSEILLETAPLSCSELREGEPIPSGSAVIIADAETDEALFSLAMRAKEAGIVRFAGCAGFAKQLVRVLDLPRSASRPHFDERPMLAVCGSISPVTLGQLSCARAAGIPMFGLSEAQQRFDPVEAALRRHGRAVVASAFDASRIDTRPGSAKAIAAQLGMIARRGWECGASLFLIGGDTLMAAVSALDGASILPAYELSSGVAVCTLRVGAVERCLVTKSGSFGGEDAICRVLNEAGK